MKKLLNFRPALLIAIGVAISVSSAYLLFTGKVLSCVLTAASYLAVIIIFTFIYRKNHLAGNLIFISVLLAITSVTFVGFYFKCEKFSAADLNGVYCTVQGKVTKVSVIDGNSSRLIVSEVEFSGVAEGRTNYKISVYVKGDNKADVGDVVKFTTPVSDTAAFYENGFRANAVNDGIKYTCSVKSTDIEIINKTPSVFEVVNIAIRNALRSGLDDKEFTVAYALICGNSDYLEDDVLTAYRYAGVAHIFAVSGMHVTFLATIISVVLRKLKVKKFISVFITVALLIFYSGVCGFTPSSLRATVMFAVLSAAYQSGKRYDALSSLSVAYILIALISPTQVAEVGCMLSFSVVLGIVLLSAPIGCLLKFLPHKLASSLGVVLSAQLFALPVSLYCFGEISLISVPVNLIFIPIVGIIYMLTFSAAILTIIFGNAAIIMFLPRYVLKGVNYAIGFFDSEKFMWGGAAIGGFALFYYLALIVPCGIINLRKALKISLAVLFAAAFVAGTTVLNLPYYKENKVYVISNKDVSMTVIDGDEENVAIVSVYKSAFSVYKISALSERKNIKKIDVLILPLSSGNPDVQSVMSRLIQVFEIKEVYYVKENKDEEYALLTKTFTDVEFHPNVNVTDCELKDGITLRERGYAVEADVRDKKILIFSKYGNEYVRPNKDDDIYDYVILNDYADRICRFYTARNYISYRKNKNFRSAETMGTITIDIT